MPSITRDSKATRLCSKCIASLCPREPDLSYTWLQGDPVCRAIKFNQRAKWIRAQQRIDKLPYPVDGFFTIGSLTRIEKVRIGMRGKCPGEYRSQKFSPEKRAVLEALRVQGAGIDVLRKAASLER